MITGEYSVIRFSEPDDALFLRGLYLELPRRAALLDMRREPLMPTTRDIHEILARKDAAKGLMYTIEDAQGVLRGWCGLRGMNYEARYAELVYVFASETDYGEPFARETLDYLLGEAFTHYGMYKVICLCLDTEPSLRQCLERRGFTHAGAQRQALYSGGAWHDLHTYVLSDAHSVASAETTASGVANP